MAINRKRQVTNQLVADTLILNGKDNTCHDVIIETTYFGLRKENGTVNGRVSFPRTRIQKVREILSSKKINNTTTLNLNQMKKEVIKRVWETYEKAAELGMITKTDLRCIKAVGGKMVEIVFNLTGRTAGQMCPEGYQNLWGVKFRFHPVLLAENFEDYMVRTVPHEVAHHIDWIMNGGRWVKRGRGSAHGNQWKGIMTRLGYENSRCHSYDTTNARGKGGNQRRWEYKCNCKTYNLSTVRHNRSQKAKLWGTEAMYRCRKCRVGLVWTGKEV